MDDLINRQVTIDMFYKHADDDGYIVYTVPEVEHMIKALPSAEQKEKNIKMKRYQIMTEEEIKNCILCVAHKISCIYCPVNEQCRYEDKELVGTNCSSKILQYLVAETDDIPLTDFPAYCDGHKDGYKAAADEFAADIEKYMTMAENAVEFAGKAYNEGWNEGRRALVRQIEEKAGIVRKERKIK